MEIGLCSTFPRQDGTRGSITWTTTTWSYKQQDFDTWTSLACSTTCSIFGIYLLSLAAVPRRISCACHRFSTSMVRFNVYLLPCASLQLILATNSITATAIHDWDFIANATIKINHNPRCMENLLSQYPELQWNKDTAPHRLALLREDEGNP